ncbi:nuclear transport factor 2 family protein [Streptomyces endophyticus]|uniref:Nuclear transport factor 2 family protein n=1 Tax=Streptomyces endophyticus TaxID=714166 RepID=A0ABU6EZ11_9ACTN|nr:nuclear transport factor 2 family protein [Streptomyces endophyticus]MEB8336984.1 nuclear transport factor 2 family protein [Streptomyces endophyticus]
MATGNEALVRRAYHLAEGDVLDVQGFVSLFAEDAVMNGIGGVIPRESYRGERLGDVVVWMGKLLPDVHRELHRVNVLGDVVAIELSIQGTFLGAFETPAGVIKPTGAKLDIPTADFWYVRDGKVQEFNCHVGMTSMFAQMGVLPDFTSADAASAPER